MGIGLRYILLLVFLNTIIQDYVIAQNALVNNSFIGTYWFKAIDAGVYGLAGTNDGGIAFISGFGAMIKIDSSKYRIATRSEILKFSKEADTMLNWSKKQPWTKDIPIYKCDKNGKIEWVNKFDAGGLGCMLKQTNDKGYIGYTRGVIIKLDSIGKTKWKINFEKDSIPGIKKTKFLTESGASDIFECKDGSFIALLSASFSLLKISKDGKPLWLKSTVFDEFDMLYTDVWDKKDLEHDTIYIRNYNQGGGIYIPTYNVYETDDGGYMAIGNNRYQYKPFLTKICEGEECSKKKYYYLPKLQGGDEPKSFIYPGKVYAYRNYTLNDEEKSQIPKRSTTVVVKTDSSGSVEWTKQFGNMSYDTSPHSDLIKLANGKWLVRIRDCDIKGYDIIYKEYQYGGAYSKAFIINDSGRVLDWFTVPGDPFNMILAADSGYFTSRQYGVIKLDKQFNTLWSQSIDVTGMAASSGIMAATIDSGVVCEAGKGYIIKINKNGDTPSTKVSVKTETKTDTAHFYIYTEGKILKNSFDFLTITRKGMEEKEIKTAAYRWRNKNYNAELYDYTCEMVEDPPHSWKYKLVKTDSVLIDPPQRPIDPGVNDTLDLLNPLHINAIIIKAEKEFNQLIFPAPEGYREIVIYNLSQGAYEYKINIPYSSDDKEKQELSGEFEIK